MNPESIFADTNLFLRYLTNDNPDQADAFEQILLRAGAGEFTLISNSLVIAEIIWTLESHYHLKKQDIQSKVLAILNTPGVEISDGNTIVNAVVWYAEKNVDYIEAFIAAWMIDNGVETIFTFDHKHFSRFDGLRTINPVD